jgi:hypothetical protein
MGTRSAGGYKLEENRQRTKPPRRFPHSPRVAPLGRKRRPRRQKAAGPEGRMIRQTIKPSGAVIVPRKRLLVPKPGACSPRSSSVRQPPSVVVFSKS